MGLCSTLCTGATKTRHGNRLHKSLEDIGVDTDEIKASAEYDPKLEEAINTVFEEDEESDGYGDDD